MSPIRTPRTIEAATALLERHAMLGAQIAGTEAERQLAIAQANAEVDPTINALLAQQAEIHAALKPWWTKAAAELTKGKRKSIELGGCQVGTRAGRDSLVVPGDDKAALAAIATAKLNRSATVLRRVLDRAAIATLIVGQSAAGKALKALGFAIKSGEDVFFITRVDSADAKISAQ